MTKIINNLKTLIAVTALLFLFLAQSTRAAESNEFDTISCRYLPPSHTRVALTDLLERFRIPKDEIHMVVEKFLVDIASKNLMGQIEIKTGTSQSLMADSRFLGLINSIFSDSRNFVHLEDAFIKSTEFIIEESRAEVALVKLPLIPIINPVLFKRIVIKKVIAMVLTSELVTEDRKTQLLDKLFEITLRDRVDTKLIWFVFKSLMVLPDFWSTCSVEE